MYLLFNNGQKKVKKSASATAKFPDSVTNYIFIRWNIPNLDNYVSLSLLTYAWREKDKKDDLLRAQNYFFIRLSILFQFFESAHCESCVIQRWTAT